MTRALVLLVLLVPFLLSASQRYPGDLRGATLNRPDGEWSCRTTELKAREGRLTWKITVSSSTITLTADYSVTKDSMCYGIITKIEYEGLQGDKDDKLKDKLPEVDDTFSFRFRVDDDEMNIRNLKGKGFDQLKNAAGRYKKKPETGREKDKEKAKAKEKEKEKEK
jgi:hypothetical protein